MSAQSAPRVAILMGSPRDAEVMQPAADMLERFGVAHELMVLSAHRSPIEVADFARTAREQGFAAIIAGAGKAAHLAGAVAANTTVPVVGVPISAGALGGLDALLSTVQMPTGIPVATVGIDAAANAALLAVGLLAVNDARLEDALDEYRAELRGMSAQEGS